MNSTILKVSYTGTQIIIAKTLAAMRIKNPAPIKFYPTRAARGTHNVERMFTVYLEVETTTGRILSGGVQVN